MAGPEVIIAVMGVTGSGKSSFIRLVTGRSDVVIGDSLDSETTQVHSYDFYHRGTKYILIDTPGFDDTNRPDSEITERILTWLSNSYASGQLLNGVIYLHRITDSRMGGTALRNNRMVRQLVGKDAFKNVTLATTFWEKVSETVGARREQELRETKDFWGGMHGQGAEMVRLKRDRGTALSIVEKIGKKGKVVMQAQDEIITQGKSINDTAAAREQKEQAQRLERELREEMERERLYLQRKAEHERRQHVLQIQRNKIEMQRKLAAEREATRAREERARMEAKAQLEREKCELEVARRRQEEKRRIELEEMERERRKQKWRDEERAAELRRKFQREYVCIRYSASWPCDKCKGRVFRYTKYYRK
ncbi:P-loop containing nucleoside triphosphate hydrolase protein [Dactylonectria macrodidyma]|uniref:P-loop containing nucleoside triphosphate hydrolase protein n=1 Tax=Dactylonectria macrodidyma TaxID=307937 RepID=A0A9P9IX54_9HYPO|nr:P-loop containing nucleoside triphosphate hydrolase protein [Dactylonectria macrodidyma]